MSRNKQFYKNNNYQKRQDNEKKSHFQVDESNAVIQEFRKLSKELDEKNDRYERIVKLSRDITIESKRIIFLLHTIDSRKNNKDEVLKQAHSRLMHIIDWNFMQIAKELMNLDQYLYARAYSAGLQEFIEAYTYYQYLSGTMLSDWEDFQAKFSYEMQKNEKPFKESTDDGESGDIVEPETSETLKSHCFIQPIEYILGLADLTGEIMRHCINSLGSGNTDACFETNKFLQKILSYYMTISNVRSKDFSQKLFTLKQSTLKTEHVCYNLVVRGTEKATLIPTDNPHFQDFNDDDEGFY